LRFLFVKVAALSIGRGAPFLASGEPVVTQLTEGRLVGSSCRKIHLQHARLPLPN
jgi:hypothetical protein